MRQPGRLALPRDSPLKLDRCHLENADHTGFAVVAMNVAAKFGKLVGDKLGRAMLLEAKLGVWPFLVKAAADRPCLCS
jgi:hypothetical protein